jgi:hypothetical protein
LYPIELNCKNIDELDISLSCLFWLTSLCYFLFVKKQSTKEIKNDEVVREKTSDDGKIVLDIIEAIHAAEKKQADTDAYMFSEEKRKMKVCLSLFHFISFYVCFVMIFISCKYKETLFACVFCSSFPCIKLLHLQNGS